MYRINDLISYDELYHHGIKGQKWGRRRFQNEDGSLTPAGKERYDDDGPNKKKEYKIPEKKSTHRLKIEESYKAKGMSDKEAEQAAARRIRGEQYAVAAAAVTVTACVAYNKYKNYNVDKTLSSNKELHRILLTNDTNAPVRDGARYVSYTKNDKTKYRGIYGGELQKKKSGELGAMKIESDMSRLRGQKMNPDKVKAVKDKKIYDMTIKSKKDIKIASEKRARETFENLYKNDPEFRKNLTDRAAANRLSLTTKKGLNSGGAMDKLAKGEGLTDKELKSKAYDAFNILLVDSDAKSRSNQNKFYNALKEQGMNAVRDMNDKKYSGYNTKNPLILFDGEFDYSYKELGNERIKKDLNKSMAQILGGKAAGIGAAYATAFGAIPLTNSRALDKQVILYKREHPNTRMSDKQIREMLKVQQKQK